MFIGPDLTGYSYTGVIAEICAMNWPGLDEAEMTAVAWGYYFFSVQFRESLQIARALFPADQNLRNLEAEECDTSNLSPWPGIARVGEKMNHDEFMRRVLTLAPVQPPQRLAFEHYGERYLGAVRGMDAMTRTLGIASYEDGGLEQVFRAMLTSRQSTSPLLRGFRHFLAEHVKFDSDASQGHGAMTRHLRPDDRILPLWTGFKNILIQFAPGLLRSRFDGDLPRGMTKGRT